MKKSLFIGSLLTLATLFPFATHAANAVLLGWNNLGMHCMDSRYAEFAILPPYNTLNAQLIVGGKLVTASTLPGASDYTVTYEAVADPVTQALNSTSQGKSDWATYAPTLFGLPSTYKADMGLVGCDMPGIDSPYVDNAPKPFDFQPTGSPVNAYQAEGIPITPYDDNGNKNFYPMMKIVAWDKTNAVVAQSNVVLPVSDEMSCVACHGANTNEAANPHAPGSADGWIHDGNPEREYRLNILKLHDEKQKNAPLYQEALSAKLDGAGLYDSATATPAKPVLCAGCHQSEALGAPSFISTQGNGTVSALTAAVHRAHADTIIPGTPGNLTLGDTDNRSACYACHPGSKTRCLRGAMGSAVANDGSMEMQCQSCHGNMSKVGDSARTGWLQEPTCQSCHTGTATDNNGKIRYTSVFDTNGLERVAKNTTFATNPNTPAHPALSLSLYRFSKGHGNLQCSACHGSTHAEFPSSHKNDNLRNEQLQGHAGVLAECSTCHNQAFDNANTLSSQFANGKRGPHGLHPMNQTWAKEHHDLISQFGGLSNCKTCHGSDLRGTELSRVQGDRSFNLGDSRGTIKFYRGATVGCYSCHNGSGSDSLNTSPVPVTQDISAVTASGQPVSMTLPATNGTGLVFRVLQQPENGTVGIQGNVATYFPFADFTGTDTFKFAGYNGSKNSDTLNKGTVAATATITVAAGKPEISAQPQNQTATAGGSASFGITATGSAPLNYQWRKNGTVITGATHSALTLGPVSAADAGNYQVRVSNAAGFADSTAATLTVNKASPAVTLSSSLNPSGYGNSVTFKTQLGGGYNPSGSVTLKDNATPLTATPLDLTNGQATFTAASLSPGTHTIIATYSGDADNLGGSAALNQTVGKAVTTLALGATPNPSAVKQTVTYTAVVSGANPTGKVAFKAGSKTTVNVTVSNSKATYSTSFSKKGSYSVKANYLGDVNNAASSTTLSQTVK